MATLRSMPRWVADSLRMALIVAVGLTLFSVYSARGDNHDTVFWACLYGGSLSQVGTTEPTTCGRGTTISWNAEGEQGEQGPPGMSGYEVIGDNEPIEVEPGDAAGQYADCPEGKVAVGGGPRQVTGPTSGSMTTEESNPDYDGTNWFALVRNDGTQAFTFRTVVACAFVELEAAPFQPYQLEVDSSRR